MTQEEKDIIIKKIDSIYGKVVRGGWDYMEGRDDALSELRVFVNNMNSNELLSKVNYHYEKIKKEIPYYYEIEEKEENKNENEEEKEQK